MLNQSQPCKPLQHTMASLSLVSMAAPPLYASLYEPFYIPFTAVVSPSVSTFSAGRNGRHFHRQTPQKTPTLSRVNCQFVQVGVVTCWFCVIYMVLMRQTPYASVVVRSSQHQEDREGMLPVQASAYEVPCTSRRCLSRI